MKTLAIDIDGTWDTDPELFLAVAMKMLTHGWKVIIVTGAVQPVGKLMRLGIPASLHVITANQGEFKKDAARRHGYDVTVWMDNEPGGIEPQIKLTTGDDNDL